MCKENNNKIVNSTILLCKLPSSTILESTPERNQHYQRGLSSAESGHIMNVNSAYYACCLYRIRKLSDFIRNILICVPKMNKCLTGLD